MRMVPTSALGVSRAIRRISDVVIATVCIQSRARRDIDQNFITSIIDQGGTLRVQYMGVRFDPDEMIQDIQSLLRERTKQ